MHELKKGVQTELSGSSLTRDKLLDTRQFSAAALSQPSTREIPGFETVAIKEI